MSGISSNWVSAGATDYNWRDVAWAEELSLFVAVGTNDALSDGIIATSPDGLSWTVRATVAGYRWQGVCWSKELGLLVAVSNVGTGNRVITSPDGIAWTQRANPEDNSWRKVAWSPTLSRFVAVSTDGTHTSMHSSDGITWTAGNLTRLNNLSVCWSEALKLFVAATMIDEVMIYSADGITWSYSATHTGGRQWTSVDWSPELKLFVAVANSSNGTYDRAFYSADGVNWSTAYLPADNQWYGVRWCPALQLFVAVAQSGTGNRVAYSKDGKYWFVGTAIPDNTWWSLAFSPKNARFVAVGGTGTGNRIVTWDFPKISGNITESLAITDWRLSADYCANGYFAGGGVTSGASYDLPCLTADPVNITLSPKIDGAWKASTYFYKGFYVVAANPDSTPHLWKCTTAGTSGASQPAWNLSGTTTDGSATWTYVAPLVDPVTLGPKIPA